MGVVAGVVGQRPCADAVERGQGHEQPALTDHLGHRAIEEGDQQGRDMGPVHVGVGHDDDALVAQVVDVERGARRGRPAPASGPTARYWPAACRRWREATFRILPRRGRMAWVVRSRACLAEPPAESPSTMNSSVPLADWREQSRQLAGQAQLAGGRGALDLLVLAAPQAVLGALDDEAQQDVGLFRALGQPVVQRVAQQRPRPASGRRARTAGPWSGPGTRDCG